MTSHEDRRKPEPLWKVILFWLAIIVSALGVGTVGRLSGPNYQDLKAAEATQDSLRAANEHLHAVLASREPWDWFLDCDPDPFSHIKNWDKVRDLVGVACPPGILIPEEES